MKINNYGFLIKFITLQYWYEYCEYEHFIFRITEDFIFHVPDLQLCYVISVNRSSKQWKFIKE